MTLNCSSSWFDNRKGFSYTGTRTKVFERFQVLNRNLKDVNVEFCRIKIKKHLIKESVISSEPTKFYKKNRLSKNLDFLYIQDSSYCFYSI